MDKKKSIVIKSPHLQAIRNNLRLLFLKMAVKEWRELFNKQEEILRNKDGTFRNMSPSERSKFQELERKKSKIDQITNTSICMCAACNDSKKDMTFNPILKDILF